MPKYLAVNAGSSTLKWRLFDMPAAKLLGQGLIDRINTPPATVTINVPGRDAVKYDTDTKDCGRVVADLLLQLKKLGLVERLHDIHGVGHRVVAGGEDFNESVIVNDDVLLKIRNLRNLAPLHNPVQANFIDTFRQVLPWATQVAVFDSAFHQSMPATSYLYGLPYTWYKQYGARKYGAHGTSVRYVAGRTAELIGRPLDQLRLIVLHLGAGSSVTAVKDGKSLDTSMGFTPLSGLISATRSGDVDPSLLAYLMRKLNVTADQMVDLLNDESGLKGISGLSDDMRTLTDAADTNLQAQLAIDMYVNRVVQYVGAYVAEMNGVDAFAFAGGIGEHSSAIRAQIMSHFQYLGATIDAKQNARNSAEVDLSDPDASVRTWLVPTDEELMIVRDTYRLVTTQQPAQ